MTRLGSLLPESSRVSWPGRPPPGFAGRQRRPATPRGRQAICRATDAVGRPRHPGRLDQRRRERHSLRAPRCARGQATRGGGRLRLAELLKARDEARLRGAAAIGGRDTGAGPVHWYEHYGAKNSRAWMVTDPQDGRIPPQTAAAQARIAGRRVAGAAGVAVSLKEAAPTRG